MTLDELAALDAAERKRLHDKAISDVSRAITIRQAEHGRTDTLQRQLAQLQATS